MSQKATLLIDFVTKREVYGNDMEAAMVAFKAAHPKYATADFNEGYFKHFWNKIFVENVMANPDHAITRDVNKYLAKHAKETTRAIITETAAPVGMTNSVVEVRTFNTANYEVDEAMFKTYLTNTVFDDIHSDDGGAMAACSVVVVGGPGVGKSTLLFWAASQYRAVHPEANIAVISSEMEMEDLLYESRRKPWMHSLDFILTSEYASGDIVRVLEKIFLTGYDVIILDSFADVVDKLRDFGGMSTTAAETWLLDLMKRAKGARNDARKYTLTFAIQQQTKGGSFAGTNKLKHNTTAMLELRRESNGDRYMTYTKNRRCGQYVGKRLYYFLGANNQVSFDIERWEREISDAQEETTATGQVQEGLDQNVLAQFDTLTGDATTRAAALLQQVEITRDADGNQVIPTLPAAVAAAPTAEAGTQEELLPGLTVDDIYHDEVSNMFILEVSSNSAITGTTVDEVVARAREARTQVTINR